MTWRHIEVERQDRVAVIRLNRPRYRNAQSGIMLDEMTAAFAELDLDSQIRVIVLAAAGDHFSAGHDIGTPEERAELALNQYGEGVLGRVSRSWHLYVENSLRWRDVRKPTIAAVQGYCIWGGFLIASCMDIIIASADAMFLPGHVQLHTAPWDLGVRNAKHILFENRFVHADEALRLGLVSEVVPREKLEQAVMAQAARWAENDLLTLRMLKQSINLAQDMMGYRTALHAGHSNDLIRSTFNPPQAATEAGAKVAQGSRVMGQVADALAKEKKQAD